MTRFIHIDPTARTVTPIEAESPHHAVPSLGLGNVDHGVVTPGIGIIVYVSIHAPTKGRRGSHSNEPDQNQNQGPYFVLVGQLYSGDAVLYAYDEAGETIDMPEADIEPLWIPNKAAVEFAIGAGLVARPQSSVGGVVTWRWS
jgi:hypothetical protein